MDFQPDHHLPVAGCAFYQFAACRTHALHLRAVPRPSAPIRSPAGRSRPACRPAGTSSRHCRGRLRPDADRRGPRRNSRRPRPARFCAPDPNCPWPAHHSAASGASRPGAGAAPDRLALNSAIVTTTSPARNVPPPARPPRRAKTASPRQRAGRSVAGRAAVPARPCRREPRCPAAPPCSPSP